MDRCHIWRSGVRVVPQRPDDEVVGARIGDLGQRRVKDELHYKIEHQRLCRSMLESQQRLTCTINAWDEEKPIGRYACSIVLEIANSACGVVEPRVRSDPALRRERERQVIAWRNLNGRVDEVRFSERGRSELEKYMSQAPRPHNLWD